MNEEESGALKAELRQLEQRAMLDIPILQKHLAAISGAARDCVHDFDVASDDYLGWMSVHFFDKQLGHAAAVRILDGHRDAALVARSMLEGLCFLKWSSHDTKRALRWHCFSVIDEWRSLRASPRPHTADLAGRLDELASYLATFGDVLLTKKARRALNSARELPEDPFIRTWYDAKLQDIFALVSASDLYTGPYGMAGDWHHWSPTGLLRANEYENREIRYVVSSPVEHASSLATACQCVAETSDFVVQHFQLPNCEKLATAIDAYINEVDHPHA